MLAPTIQQPIHFTLQNVLRQILSQYFSLNYKATASVVYPCLYAYWYAVAAALRICKPKTIEYLPARRYLRSETKNIFGFNSILINN